MLYSSVLACVGRTPLVVLGRALAAREGILAGGSSGAVVAAIERLRPRLPEHWQVLTVLPDRGDRYLDQVYDDAWVARLPAFEAVLP